MSRTVNNNKRVHIRMHEDILAELELYLNDPVKGRLRYGALAEITNRLFRQWLNNLRAAEDRIAFLRAYGVNIPEDEVSSVPQQTEGETDNA